MSPRHLMPWLLLVAFVTACASSSPPEQRRRPPPRVLFESPLALLLEHHEELQLTTDQLIKIGQQDEALTAANKPLREQLREVWHPEPPPGGGPPPGAGMPGRNAPVGLGGRPSYRSPDRPSPPPLSEEDKKRQQALLQAMEDNEAAAYREVEASLDASQKVKARALIEKQREERAHARESMQSSP